MSAETESHTRLHGRWLLAAQLAWVAVFITLTVMYALGFLAVRDTLSTVCVEEGCTLVRQIRYTEAGEKVMGWPGPSVGHASRLRPDQVRALERLGLSLDQYGWLTALQMGIPVMILLLIAAGLFWRKSDDWMVLFASIMIATFPLHNTPLPFTLMVRQPAWEWVDHLTSVVALSCLWIFPLIFPNGQFVPRWTRWMAIYEVAGAVIGAFFGDTIREVRGVTLFFGIVFLLPSFCIGVYAQLYRYFRVARPAERQQFKWVVFGLVGFVVTQFVLIALNALVTSPAFSAEPARALVLSAIPDTLWQANNLLIAVCIVISVLRFRLWDVDIVINRSLVYSTLIAIITGLYVLVVGSLGGLLQNEIDLAAPAIALLIVVALVQPLHRVLQNKVNRLMRFVPGERADTPNVLQESSGQLEQAREEDVEIHAIPEPDPASHTRLKGNWLWAARLGCAASIVLAVILHVAALPVAFDLFRTPCFSEPCDTRFETALPADSGQPEEEALRNAWNTSILEVLVLLLSLSVALFIFWRRSDDWMAHLASIMLVSILTAISPWPTILAEAKPFWHWPRALSWAIGLGSSVWLFYLFPDGRFVPRWTSRLAMILLLIIAFVAVLGAPLLAGLAIFVVILISGTVFQIFRYRLVSGPIQRQQTKWVVLGILGMALPMVFVLCFGILNPSLSPFLSNGTRSPQAADLFSNMVIYGWAIPVSFFPVTLAFSILRYRLWDVDFFINRTLVYGALTGIIVSAFVILVGFISILFQSSGNSIIAILATGLVALLFNPLRQRLQRSVNQLMYGERDDPYVALSRLGRQLESSLAPEAVLPTVVTTVREVLKLPYVSIYLQQDTHGYKIVAESASPSLRIENGRIRVPGMEREGLCMPLLHQGETVGYIVLGPRAPNEAFTSTDLRLLKDIAPQVGVAIHAVRLTADLQRSREQLVLAREEERRRLRRDLHDGLGPQLAGLALKLETLRNRMNGDPLADSILADLAKRTQEATADIRHLVYELRPPTLDELGLASALRESVGQFTQQGCNDLNITFDAPESLPPLPAAVEVAVYRITQEALTNVIRHADAHNCQIRLSLDANAGFLCLEVQDDGKGLLMKRRAGVGLNSMRERTEELGGAFTITSVPTGGTLLAARLPCRVNDRNTGDSSQKEAKEWTQIKSAS